MEWFLDKTALHVTVYAHRRGMNEGKSISVYNQTTNQCIMFLRQRSVIYLYTNYTFFYIRILKNPKQNVTN